MKNEKPLSEKHKRFVRLVRSGRSAASAYAAAYDIYNSPSARAASCRLMKDARILAAINKGRKPAPQIIAAVEMTKPNAAQLEANIREKLRPSSGQISEPPPIQRIALPPKYHRPPAPSEQEALRRRLRLQGISGFGFTDNEAKGEWK